MSDEEIKIQIYPPREIFLGIDKMKQRIFDATDNNTARDIIEDKKSMTITRLDVWFTEEFKAEKNLTPLDELVFDCCMTEQAKGNEFTTPAIIHRLMGGSKKNFSFNEKDKILSSVRKLATTFIDFDMTDICKKFGYNDGKGYKYSGYLLPCEYITATVNGQTESATIHFLRNTPLFDVAKMKNQFIICDSKLLEVPNSKSKENVMSLKSCLWRRILQIVGSHKPHKKHFCGRIKGGGINHRTAKKLSTTILLDTVFEQCGLSDATNNRKAEYRNTISKIMEHFKEEGLISEWHFEKENGKFHSVKFEPLKSNLQKM